MPNRNILPLRLVVICLLVSTVTLAQKEEWVTNFATKIGFQIDFPADWANAFEEKKSLVDGTSYEVLGTSTQALRQSEVSRSVVITADAYDAGEDYDPPIESSLKAEIKKIQKEAKKAKDPTFEIIDSGTGKLENSETRYSWLEYTYGSYDRFGNRSELRLKVITYYPKGRFIKYAIKLVCSTTKNAWYDSGPIFEHVIQSYKEF